MLWVELSVYVCGWFLLVQPVEYAGTLIGDVWPVCCSLRTHARSSELQLALGGQEGIKAAKDGGCIENQLFVLKIYNRKWWIYFVSAWIQWYYVLVHTNTFWSDKFIKHHATVTHGYSNSIGIVLMHITSSMSGTKWIQIKKIKKKQQTNTYYTLHETPLGNFIAQSEDYVCK